MLENKCLETQFFKLELIRIKSIIFFFLKEMSRLPEAEEQRLRERDMGGFMEYLASIPEYRKVGSELFQTMSSTRTGAFNSHINAINAMIEGFFVPHSDAFIAGLRQKIEEKMDANEAAMKSPTVTINNTVIQHHYHVQSAPNSPASVTSIASLPSAQPHERFSGEGSLSNSPMSVGTERTLFPTSEMRFGDFMARSPSQVSNATFGGDSIATDQTGFQPLLGRSRIRPRDEDIEPFDSRRSLWQGSQTQGNEHRPQNSGRSFFPIDGPSSPAQITGWPMPRAIEGTQSPMQIGHRPAPHQIAAQRPVPAIEGTQSPMQIGHRPAPLQIAAQRPVPAIEGTQSPMQIGHRPAPLQIAAQPTLGQIRRPTP